MPTEPASTASAANGMTLLAAADLQDHLMVAGNDLQRLQGLLDDASQALMAHFQGAREQLAGLLDDGALRAEGGHRPVQQAMQTLGGAVVALQFQDMATQLIAHTSQRLRNCADRLARDTLGDTDEDGTAMVAEEPLRPNPVTQDEMDAGSIELF